MQDKDYDLSRIPPPPERGTKIMGLPAKHVGVAALLAAACFLYAYGIETQEFICSFVASDRETPVRLTSTCFLATHFLIHI